MGIRRAGLEIRNIRRKSNLLLDFTLRNDFVCAAQGIFTARLRPLKNLHGAAHTPSLSAPAEVLGFVKPLLTASYIAFEEEDTCHVAAVLDFVKPLLTESWSSCDFGRYLCMKISICQHIPSPRSLVRLPLVSESLYFEDMRPTGAPS